MTGDLERIITGAIGEDSGWRVVSETATTELIDVNIISMSARRLALRNPNGMNITYSLRQGAAGVPMPMAQLGWNGAQEFFRTRLGKVFTGPLGRSGVNESDIRGLYRSLSLGLSTEGSQNVTLIFFGDWATGLSLFFSAVPQLSIGSIVAGATAVAVVPSAGSGVHTAIGHCW